MSPRRPSASSSSGTSSPSPTKPPTPLMSPLSRLSRSSSRASVPSHDKQGYTNRTLRFVSNGGKQVFRRSGLSSLWGSNEGEAPSLARQQSKSASSSPPKPKSPRQPALDISKIIYPTLKTHPQPTPYPIMILSLSQISSVSPIITNDELFDVLLQSLEPWVGEEGEGGYVLVILAADDRKNGRDGMRRWPGIGWWVWKWKRIPRKYRKNLKRVYIVHPSLFTRTLLPFLLPLLSPKSYGKLYPLSSFLSLHHEYSVPLNDIELTVPVLNEEAKIMRERPDAVPLARRKYPSTWTGSISSSIRVATSYLPIPHLGRSVSRSIDDEEETHGYWRRSVEDIVAASQGKPPRLLIELRKVILECSTDTEGIFRRTSNSPLLGRLVPLLDLPIEEQPNIPWAKIAKDDPLLPPKVLLRFLAELSPSLIPPALYPIMRSCTTTQSIVTELLPALSEAQYLVLDYIVHLAHSLSSHEGLTKMSPLAYAIVLSPAMIAGPDPMEDAEMCLAPGKTLPAAMTGDRKSHKGGQGTLVGVLEMWIRDWENVSKEREHKRISFSPRHGKQGSKHVLLGGMAKTTSGAEPAEMVSDDVFE